MTVDKLNLIKLLGLPEEFGFLVLATSFILVLTPYISGVDFGIVKVPAFESEQTERNLRWLGPVLFFFAVALHVPFSDPNRVKDKTGEELSRVQLPEGIQLESAINQIVTHHVPGYGIRFNDCPDSTLSLRLRGGLIQARGEETAQRLIRRLSERILTGTPNLQLEILANHESGVFTVRCIQ